MKLITRTCKCCDADFEAPNGKTYAYITRCAHCRMNCDYRGPFCKER